MSDWFQEGEVTLRRWRPEDEKEFLRWRNDPEVWETNEPGIMHLVSEDDFQSWFSMISRGNSSFAITLAGEERAIGSVGLTGIDHKNRHGEFFVLIGERELWGKGYAKKALKVVIRYGFNELNLHKIYGKVFSMNERATALYQSLGFKEDGRSRDHLWRHGQWWDECHLSLLASEFAG